ncbi:glycosyltransferase family 2 protein [Puniceibacterium confluentis]|uniref:glycosyltransferase family 2 protein n=1 Tax=Puniceibacterium confluentis TaxID=1958944 RepID=UPI0011B7E89E|nr:glycosyltransferase family 2 protein [Puniceibacterium confluentis]
MKICALTMVYKDYWALSQWYRHHGRQVGVENLFVVAHGADPRIGEICPGASVITVPRDGFDHFDRRRGAALNAFQAGLLQSYDWVIRTDADELICHDPHRYESLADAIAAHAGAPVLTALGFDLVEQPGDPQTDEGSVFTARRHAAFSGHYSKAFAIRRPLDLMLHGVRVSPRRLQGFPFAMPPGVYLAHLKYANISALYDANLIREQVGRSGDAGAPGSGWSAATADASAFLARFADKRELPWPQAEARAYDRLSVNPARLEKSGIVKTRALKFDFRTRLCDRFLTL